MTVVILTVNILCVELVDARLALKLLSLCVSLSVMAALDSPEMLSFRFPLYRA